MNDSDVTCDKCNQIISDLQHSQMAERIFFVQRALNQQLPLEKTHKQESWGDCEHHTQR